MKIINSARPFPNPFDKHRSLEAEILRLHEDVGIILPSSIYSLSLMSYERKYQYYSVLRTFASEHQGMTRDVHLTQTASTLQWLESKRVFHLFKDLPSELRLKIWGHTCVQDTKPRLHCVDELAFPSGPKFESNHTISPLLHTSHESRSFYLSQAKYNYAFGTYVNFDVDVIYLRHMGDLPDSFPRFIKQARKVQKLAMTADFYCDELFGLEYPNENIMEKWELELRLKIPKLKEILLVFGDYEDSRILWLDTESTVKDLSANARRRTQGMAYARNFLKYNHYDGKFRGKTMAIRFVNVVPSDQAGIIKRKLGIIDETVPTSL